MIIAVVGGEGTGKTSVAMALVESTRARLLEPLKAQVLAESGYHTIFEWEAATGGLPALLERQAQREAELASGVIDGGVVELYVFAQRWAWNKLSPSRWAELRGIALTAARRYDRLVIAPARIVAGPAPGRFRNADHNAQLLQLIEMFARDLPGRVTLLPDAALDARIAAARAP